jgi:hypothetical protein
VVTRAAARLLLVKVKSKKIRMTTIAIVFVVVFSLWFIPVKSLSVSHYGEQIKLTQIGYRPTTIIICTYMYI